MAQELNINIALGSSKSGLTLKAQLVNASGANVGGEVTGGFSDIGQGNYLWHYAAYPDDFTGGVKFINDADEALMAFVGLNASDFGAGGSGDDPLESLVPGSYAAGTAGAALGRIGVGVISVTSALAPGGDLFLYQGDTYSLENGRALEFIDEDATWPDLTGGEAKFYLQDLVINAEVTTPTKITVELTATQTASLSAIKKQYAVKVIFAGVDPDPDEVITLTEGRAIVKEAP
jgi:hypothetical protein